MIEINIPKPSPSIIIPFNGVEPLQGQHINALLHYVHNATKGLVEGAELKQKDGSTLVLLKNPVQGWCIASGSTITFTAAIITECPNGHYDGWLIKTHEDAIRVFEEDD